MSKEKLKEMGELQEIIDKGDWDVHDSEDVKWLINYAKGQSERVQELEEKLKNYTAYIEQLEEDDTRMMRDIRRLGKQNKRYREAIGKAMDDVMKPNIT